MHASLAFVNGAGDRRRSPGSRTEGEELRLLNTLLSTATVDREAYALWDMTVTGCLSPPTDMPQRDAHDGIREKRKAT